MSLPSVSQVGQWKDSRSILALRYSLHLHWHWENVSPNEHAHGDSHQKVVKSPEKVTSSRSSSGELASSVCTWWSSWVHKKLNLFGIKPSSPHPLPQPLLQQTSRETFPGELDNQHFLWDGVVASSTPGTWVEEISGVNIKYPSV